MVAKYMAGHDVEASGFDPRKELIWASDAAECRDGAVDIRQIHMAMDVPNGARPAEGPQVGFEREIVCRDGENMRSPNCIQWFAEVAGGEQSVIPVVAVDEKDVDISKELTMLKSVVQDVN